VDDREWLAEQFEGSRAHLRAVAYRMLGSMSDADDAVQESWLRLSRSDVAAVANLRGWLTTVVGRVCLDMLRTRRARREDYVGTELPEPVVRLDAPEDPEQEALLADSVGLALLVVLDTLTPPERLAFVLHDMFGVPFDEIAPIVDRSPAAARQLASRARSRVRGRAPEPDADLARQREAVAAFLAAARAGDFDALVALLDPDVVFRVDAGPRAPQTGPPVVGAAAAARAVLALGAPYAPLCEPALVNGAAGLIVAPGGRLLAASAFTVVGGRIASIDVVADPAKLRLMDVEG
jgi:RNA polymerase sigma-70 factor (ECF subfamily)